jgi:FtsP/CotA-like multicopper oxidase with cupredoxin domain
MNGDWKEFHLVAEPVVRELAPGMKAYLWGYNGQSPGPTIEAVEGDKVRIFVTNKLPENTRSTGTASACPTAWTASAA